MATMPSQCNAYMRVSDTQSPFSSTANGTLLANTTPTIDCPRAEDLICLLYTSDAADDTPCVDL
eukprot:2920528-Amphidinium_carterae.1